MPETIPQPERAGAVGSTRLVSRLRFTGLHLTHLTEMKGDGRWVIGDNGATFLETRSSVMVLRWLRKHGVLTPNRMGTKTTFSRDWSVRLYRPYAQIG